MTDAQKNLLRLTAAALKNEKTDVPVTADTVREACAQTVLPLVYSVLSDEDRAKCRGVFAKCVSRIIRVTEDHIYYASVLEDAGIPYVVIKGVASSEYYPEPELRMLGDVDILVNEEDFSRACGAYLAAGMTEDLFYPSEYHRTFIAGGHGKAELHRSVNGIPDSPEGGTVSRYLAGAADSCRKIYVQDRGINVPDRFRHGLILLVHSANHLLQAGLGLRHLCDWAVFVDSMTDSEFSSLFREKLEECGLWRFACVLTQICVRYLGAEPKPSARALLTDEYCESFIADIFDSGNLGQKNPARLNQSKIIADKKSGTTGRKSLAGQFFSTMKIKAGEAYPVCRQHPSLTGIGMIKAGTAYIGKIRRGEKPQIDPRDMINGARERKKIYSEFRLFEKDV